MVGARSVYTARPAIIVRFDADVAWHADDNDASVHKSPGIIHGTVFSPRPWQQVTDLSLTAITLSNSYAESGYRDECARRVMELPAIATIARTPRLFAARFGRSCV